MGRGGNTKYTPERVKRIIDALALGATRRLACLYAGVSEDSFARWLGRRADFADAVKDAEGRAAVGWLAKIEKAANEGEWTAAAWKLERRYPDEYGRRERMDAPPASGPQVAVVILHERTHLEAGYDDIDPRSLAATWRAQPALHTG